MAKRTEQDARMGACPKFQRAIRALEIVQYKRQNERETPLSDHVLRAGLRSMIEDVWRAGYEAGDGLPSVALLREAVALDCFHGLPALSTRVDDLLRRKDADR